MKRFMTFMLAFIMVMGSITSFAAPGDIIHTGNKKVYKPDSQELVDDIINGADLSKFYKEVETNDGSRKFINIVEEENNQFQYIEKLVKDNNLTSPEELAAYLKNNETKINNEFKKIADEISKPFDGIVDTDKGSLDDYFGDSKAPILKTPENYSTPVPGYADGRTKIVNLTLPKGANSWIYKLDEKEFTDLGIDTIVEGTKYNSGTDIKVEAGKHLLLGAVDSAGKLKAYASIKILDNMIKKPRVVINPDPSINPTLSPAENYSGATKVSGVLGDGSWKIAVLDKLPEIVYEDSKFTEFKEYEDGMEIIVATDSELDKGLTEFKKHLIIYNEIDGKIEKYKIFNLDVNNVSGILKAEPLISEKDNSTDYNYSTPTTGDSAGTTKIETLNLPKGASNWMYAMVDNDLIVPNRDRVYEGSNPYEAGQSIKVSSVDHLMILATDNSGKVRAYGIIKVEAGMIKNPLATELRETTHYTKPVKGTGTGSTQFGFLKYDGVSSWKYKFSDTVIEAPELGSELTDGEIFTLTDNKVDNMSIESDLNKLKEDNFRRYMMIYGLNDKDEVRVYKNFIMNDTNVRMPDAGTLGKDTHYFGNTKGNNPNTTRFGSLATTGIPGTNLKFKYKVLDEEITSMEFNKIIEGTYDLRPNVDISVTAGKHLLILVVDESNKTKAFTTIPLTFDNVKAGNATLLQPTTNYVGPMPGGGSNSTKFTFLNEDSKFVYKLGDTSFGIPESGSVVEGGTVITQNGDITQVAANKYLLLLAVKEEDGKDKVIAYREFRLLDNQVKGGYGTELVAGAYGLMKGDKPSTTKLKLEPLGLENPSSIRWRYKLVDNVPTENKDKPYFNEIVDGTTSYSVNSTTKIGPDIVVEKKADKDYGKVLILATDSSGRTKAYAYVPITDAHVKEHAPEIKENLELIDGAIKDSVKFKDLTGPTTGNKYKYLISTTKATTPAIGDSLPNGVVDYDKDGSEYKDITVNIGKYLSLYEVDKDNKIVKFSSIEVTKVKQGTAKLEILPTNLVEGNIVNGGPKLTITLTGAKWADLVNDKSARDKLFNGFKADNQISEWDKVVNSMITDGKGGISISTDVDKNILTILLPETPSYDIKEEQIISLTIPFESIEGALNPIILTDTIQIKPTIGATISGDVVSGVVRQADIEVGGKTIVIELSDGAWAHDVSGIIDGFSSSVVGSSNWSIISNEIKKTGKTVRNSSSKVTITLPPVSGLDFGTTTEVISLKIDEDKNLIQGATEDVVASPKFSLYPNKITVKGNAVTDKDKITLMAPDYRIIDTTNDAWIIEVSQGKLNETITDKDLIVTGLPRGLTANVSKVSGQNQIQIKLTGTASDTLASDTIVKIKIKGSAVSEPNSVDSEEIGLKLVRGSSMMKDLEKVKVNVVDGKLLNTTSDMQYSLDSTNGTNSDKWYSAKPEENQTYKIIPEGFKACKVYVRDKNNTNVFHLVTTLVTPKAPTGVSVNNVDYTSEVGKAKVKLDLPSGVNYDYSVDGGKDWVETFISTDDITLDPDSDLRIRLRATEKELASLATVKLNGLYLGDVKLNVGSGTITGTNTSMQYSLDSTDGIDGKWATAKANETLVTLLPSHMVWIRQQTSKVNFNKLGDVVAESSPDLSTGITYNIKEKEITNGTGQSLEYKVTGGNWTKMKTKDDNNGVTEKVSFAPGSLEIRTSGTPTTLASTPLTLANIPNPIDPPELKGNDDKKTISYLDTDNSWKEIDSSFEYKIGSSIEWKSGDTFKDDPSKTQTVVIYVRKAATDKLLPSKEKSISFTANINFANIIFDIAGKSILGTTTDMEYSISSTAENNNIWKTAGNGDTPIEPFEGMYIWLREKNKPSTETLYVEKLARQVIPDLTYVYYNMGTKKISNQSSYNLEYRINNNSWTKIDAKTDLYDIDFVPGKLEFRQRSTNEKMESNPNLKDTIKAKSSGPKVEIDDVENKVMSIISPTLDRSKLEYRVNSINDNSPWISGELLDGEDLNGNKIIEIRVKADDKTLSSQVTKVEFTKNLELGHVKLSTHVKPLELNGTTAQMEYMINDSNKWLPCIDGDTKLKRMDGTTDLNDINLINKLEIRDSKQHANTFIVYQK